MEEEFLQEIGRDMLSPLIEVGASCSMALTGQVSTGYPRVSHGFILCPETGSFQAQICAVSIILLPSSRIFTAAFTSLSISFPHSQR